MALTAIVSVSVANAVSEHGLYHALIEAACLPYVPWERPPDFDIRHDLGGASQAALHSHHHSSRVIWTEPTDVPPVMVGEVMSSGIVTVKLDKTKREVLQDQADGKLEDHHGFPVLAENGRKARSSLPWPPTTPSVSPALPARACTTSHPLMIRPSPYMHSPALTCTPRPSSVRPPALASAPPMARTPPPHAFPHPRPTTCKHPYLR